MALELLQSLNEHVNQASELEVNIEQNIGLFFEGLDVGAPLCEDAARVLANIAIQLGSKGQIQDFDKAVDMVAGLRAVGSAVNRDALNIKAPLFKLIVQRAGENPQIDQAISKVAQHPSFRSVRQEVEDMLKGAVESGDPKDVRNVVQLIQKLRLGYERVFNKLNSQAGEQQAASGTPSGATGTAS